MSGDTNRRRQEGTGSKGDEEESGEASGDAATGSSAQSSRSRKRKKIICRKTKDDPAEKLSTGIRDHIGLPNNRTAFTSLARDKKMVIRQRLDDFLKTTFTAAEYEELCNFQATIGSLNGANGNSSVNGINGNEVKSEPYNVKEEPDEDDLMQMVEDNADIPPMQQNEDPCEVASYQAPEDINPNPAGDGVDTSDSESIISNDGENEPESRSTARGIKLEVEASQASDTESTIEDSYVDKWMNPDERSMQSFGGKSVKCMYLVSNGKEVAKRPRHPPLDPCVPEAESGHLTRKRKKDEKEKQGPRRSDRQRPLQRKKEKAAAIARDISHLEKARRTHEERKTLLEDNAHQRRTRGAAKSSGM